MNDRLLVEALQSRDPGALGAIYDAYADRLYEFCWFQLRNRDAAQVAFRDTLIVAEAHIEKLREPDRFGPWLYALARIECGRRLPLSGQKPDIPVASHDQHDVDQRIMAWGAVMGLPQRSREILELRVRHQLSIPDLAAVFVMSPKEVEAALERARGELEAALTAEILAHEGPYGCPGRAVILRDRQGDLTGELRSRLLRHAKGCQVCGAFPAGAVSPAKVYGLLPQAEPPNALRLRVMSAFIDPELVSYRLFAAARLEEFTPNGFPIPQRRALLRRGPDLLTPGRMVRRWRYCLQLIAGIAATVLIAGIAFSLVRWAVDGPDRRDGHTAAVQATPTAVPQQPPVGPGGQPPRQHAGDGPGDTAPVSATFPLGARGSAAPPLPPSRSPMRRPLPPGSINWPQRPRYPWPTSPGPSGGSTHPSPTPTGSTPTQSPTHSPTQSPTQSPTDTSSPTPSTSPPQETPTADPTAG